MPVNPTYPGIYIEELPSSARTITAVPTSNTVFIGYSHPFKTKPDHWNKAVPVFSFAEYEREFGGLFRSAYLFSDLPYAVQNFFLNGGSVAYIVAIEPVLEVPNATTTTGIVFEAREPTDGTFQLCVKLNNFKDGDGGKKLADLTITYGTPDGNGTRIETFRKLPIDQLEETLNGTASKPARSALVRVSLTEGTTDWAYPATNEDLPLTYGTEPEMHPPEPDKFTKVFQADSWLDKVDVINLMALPGICESTILSEAQAFCERKRAFLIMDPPRDASADGFNGMKKIYEDVVNSNNSNGLPKSNANAALYFPYLASLDRLTGKVDHFPPSGFVAGVYARTDTNRGVWKAPAGLEATVNNTLGVVESGRMTDMRAGILNNGAINALRTFPGTGTVVFGARTVTAQNPAFQQWKYVPVRRTALFIEQTLYANLGWVVFEPNAEPLWVAIRTSIEAFMLSLFRQGAFFGTKPSEAFLVKCDGTTTTQTDIDNGRVNILVGFRPLKPAEFVIIQIAQLAGQAQT